MLALLLLALQSAPPPNVLFVVADDQRPDTIRALGNEAIHTPTLDELARTGTALTRTYCMGSYSGAVCAPSRAMLLSGRQLFHYVEQPFAPDDPDAVLLPEVFRAAGWQTFGTGKWHNGKQWFQRCFEDGGAIFFGGMGPHVGLMCRDYDPSGAYPNDARYAEPRFSSTAFAEETIAFLQRRDRDRPFFVWLSFTAPHDPRTPPAEVLARYQPDTLPVPPNFLPEHPFHLESLRIRDEKLAPWPRTEDIVREHLADYYAMITQLDTQLGRVLDTLREQDELDNTIVVYASDHGLAVGSHGLFGKQNLYEHSMRTTALIRAPGLPAGARVDELAYLYDLAPTVCALAGLPVPSSMEGRSLLRARAGTRAGTTTGAQSHEAGTRALGSDRDGVLTAYRATQRAWTEDDWKLIWYPELTRYQLFHLAEDPHEVNDLIGESRHGERVLALQARMRAAMRAAGDPLAAAFDQSRK